MFGSHVLEIPYYGIIHDTLNGHDVTISRTGFSAEVGFEIYLRDAMLYADDVWPHILEQGEEFNLRVDSARTRAAHRGPASCPTGRTWTSKTTRSRCGSAGRWTWRKATT